MCFNGIHRIKHSVLTSRNFAGFNSNALFRTAVKDSITFFLNIHLATTIGKNTPESFAPVLSTKQEVLTTKIIYFLTKHLAFYFISYLMLKLADIQPTLKQFISSRFCFKDYFCLANFLLDLSLKNKTKLILF